jgi:hypothetical protein
MEVAEIIVCAQIPLTPMTGVTSITESRFRGIAKRKNAAVRGYIIRNFGSAPAVDKTKMGSVEKASHNIDLHRFNYMLRGS